MFRVLLERAAEKDLSRKDWRIRVGDYRVVYEIAEEIRIVRVNRVRHRREVYR
jgi:mRNA interferase RelE/StbE